MKLSAEQLAALREALARRPEVARALFLRGSGRPTLVLEYDERPASVADAQARLQRLIAAVRPPLGDAVFELGSSAGGPEDVARFASGAEVLYERGQAE